MAPKEKNAQPFITDYKEHHTDATVHFVVKMTPEKMEQGAEGRHREEVQAHQQGVHLQHALLRREGQHPPSTNPEAMMSTFVPSSAAYGTSAAPC